MVPKGTSGMDAPPRDKLTGKIFPLPISYYCPRMKWQQLEGSWGGIRGSKGQLPKVPTNWSVVFLTMTEDCF